MFLLYIQNIKFPLIPRTVRYSMYQGLQLMNETVRRLVENYDLKPLPVEGTLFSSRYNSPYSTAMIGLYCREPLSRSLFHRLDSDEVWHFYSGDPFRLILLKPDGSSEDVIMGGNPLEGQYVQFVVPAGVWQAGELLEDSDYALYGCTMAPGFEKRIFTGGGAKELLPLYRGRKRDIENLACPENWRNLSDEL